EPARRAGLSWFHGSGRTGGGGAPGRGRAYHQRLPGAGGGAPPLAPASGGGGGGARGAGGAPPGGAGVAGGAGARAGRARGPGAALAPRRAPSPRVTGPMSLAPAPTYTSLPSTGQAPAPLSPMVTSCSRWILDPPRTLPLMTTPWEWTMTKPGPKSAPRPMT